MYQYGLNNNNNPLFNQQPQSFYNYYDNNNMYFNPSFSNMSRPLLQMQNMNLNMMQIPNNQLQMNNLNNFNQINYNMYNMQQINMQNQIQHQNHTLGSNKNINNFNKDFSLNNNPQMYKDTVIPFSQNVTAITNKNKNKNEVLKEEETPIKPKIAKNSGKSQNMLNDTTKQPNKQSVKSNQNTDVIESNTNNSSLVNTNIKEFIISNKKTIDELFVSKTLIQTMCSSSALKKLKAELNIQIPEVCNYVIQCIVNSNGLKAIMCHHTANYYFQSIIENISLKIRKEVIGDLSLFLLNISCNQFGIYSIQKFFSLCKTKEELDTIESLVLKKFTSLLKDKYGFYLIIKIFELIKTEDRQDLNSYMLDNIHWIVNTIYGTVVVRFYIFYLIYRENTFSLIQLN